MESDWDYAVDELRWLPQDTGGGEVLGSLKTQGAVGGVLGKAVTQRLNLHLL